MKFMLLMSLLMVMLSCWYSSLLSSVLFFLGSVFFLIPEMHLDWRGFFLAWVYISGMFILLVYTVTFSVNSKQKISLWPILALFILFKSTITDINIGSGLSFFFFNSSLSIYTFLVFFCVSLLPLMSYFFGPTTSCRKSI